LLESLDVELDRRDFFRERFSRDELEELLTRIGASPADVLSTRSKAYKTLGLAGRDVADRDLLDLMVAEPTLLRRPLIVSGSTWVAGFDRQRIAALVEDQEREGE
jgi:arsenate reductase-like glutaredoxin family protein